MRAYGRPTLDELRERARDSAAFLLRFASSRGDFGMNRVPRDLCRVGSHRSYRACDLLRPAAEGHPSEGNDGVMTHVFIRWNDISDLDDA